MTQASPYAAIAAVFEKARDLDAPLNARLMLLAEAVREGSPEFAGAVERLIERLVRTGLGANAPKPGDPMPPFLLPDPTGRLVSLGELLNGGPVVLSFLRGHWCPYCRLTADAFSKVQDRIGASHMVAITPERAPFNARLAAETGIGYPVLADPDSGYALSLNLAFWVDDAFADLMRSVGQDLASYQAQGAWVLPVPATYVVGSDGIVAARHVDPDYRRRMEIEDLAAAFEAAL